MRQLRRPALLIRSHPSKRWSQLSLPAPARLENLPHLQLLAPSWWRSKALLPKRLLVWAQARAPAATQARAWALPLAALLESATMLAVPLALALASLWQRPIWAPCP